MPEHSGIRATWQGKARGMNTVRAWGIKYLPRNSSAYAPASSQTEKKSRLRQSNDLPFLGECRLRYVTPAEKGVLYCSKAKKVSIRSNSPDFPGMPMSFPL